MITNGEEKAKATLIEQADLLESLCEHGVHNEDQYQQALKLIDCLMSIEKMTKDQGLSMMTLVGFVEIYEDKHYPM